VVVFAAVLLVAGCGGGGRQGGTKSIGGSNNTSVCTYVKRFGKRRVYVEIAVSPVSLESTVCRAFNARFGGRKMPAVLPAGTGRPHCDYNKGRVVLHDQARRVRVPPHGNRTRVLPLLPSRPRLQARFFGSG
jgi:hypothetical protein